MSALLLGVVTARGDVIQDDAAVYYAMAGHPWTFTKGPLGYRLLTPSLVHLIATRFFSERVCQSI